MGPHDAHSYVQDAVGNYYDCRLTLQPAAVSFAIMTTECCYLQKITAMPCWLRVSCLASGPKLA